jgi:hypothetical protein
MKKHQVNYYIILLYIVNNNKDRPNEIINFSEDNSNSSQPNQNLLSLNLATMDTINEDLSDSGYINRNLESNLDEIFDGLNFFISNEK